MRICDLLYFAAQGIDVTLANRVRGFGQDFDLEEAITTALQAERNVEIKVQRLFGRMMIFAGGFPVALRRPSHHETVAVRSFVAIVRRRFCGFRDSVADKRDREVVHNSSATGLRSANRF